MAAHHPDVASNLAVAVIASSKAPLLLLDGDLRIVAVSESFTSGFRIDPAAAVGRKLAELGGGEWNIAQLINLLRATAAGSADVEAYETELVRPGRDTRCLTVNAQKLSYGDALTTRLLVAVVDTTEARIAARLKDDLLHEKAILLQELQHRVANSLQIIASVLLQSARRVQSDETRSHLQAAHQRVMSVAAVQQQLSASNRDEVALRTYFTELCASLGASMIHDHDKLKLDVTADDTKTGADMSISLGLIVTELVINALKHAFPDDRPGHITVDYHAHAADWTLTVTDDGVGINPGRVPARPGLGTSIVQALARQLGADVVVGDAKPGTSVSVTHSPVPQAPVIAV